MEGRLVYILERVNSRQFAKLWLFFREYFHDDASCFSFFIKRCMGCRV